MHRLPYPLCLLTLVLLVAPTQAQQINFGFASTFGASEMVISQPQNQTEPGAVYIYHRSLDGASWSQTAKLTASDGATGNGFGLALDLDGNTLLVGAVAADGGQGAAYLFEKDATSGGWSEVKKLSADDPGENDNLGGSVAVSGNLAVLGAPGNNDNTGAAYVFYRNPSSSAWAQAFKLVGSDAASGDRFGGSVATADGKIYVGATGHNDNTGAVYIFGYDQTAHEFKEEAKLVSSDTDVARSFGAAIHIHEDLALISAPGQPPMQDGTAPVDGAVFAFQFDAGTATWVEQAKIQPSDGAPMNLFGFSIDYDGHRAMIGAPGINQFQGGAYLFEKSGDGMWVERERLSPDGDGLMIAGISVAQTGFLAAIGVPGADSGEGKVAIFERDGDNGWSEQAAVMPPAVEGLVAITGGQVDCADGAAAAFDCNNVDLAAYLPNETIGADRGVKLNDIWGWTDSQTGKEYALVGRTDGTSFVDVSDPTNPIYLGDLPLTEGANSSAWRDIKVYNDHAFIVADNAGQHGMQVFDLTQLRTVMDAPVTFEQTANYDGIFSAHNIVINEETGYAYAVGSSGGGESCGGGLHMIDIRQPAEPTFAGCFADTETGRNRTGYSHDAQCVTYDGPDTEHSGKEICFGSNETALSIADVSDKDNPIKLSNASYPNVGYSHQGWLTEDHRYFYMNDELDELQGKVDGTRTLVWDVEDLDDPQLVREYFSENKASDHNLYIRGNLMYQSNYLSGLRIFDISDVANPVEVGFFDTVPFGDDAPGFGGSWSNYPYFQSGSIVVTSMSEGLFVLKKKKVDI